MKVLVLMFLALKRDWLTILKRMNSSMNVEDFQQKESSGSSKKVTFLRITSLKSFVKSPSAFREKDVFLKLYTCSRNNLNCFFVGTKEVTPQNYFSNLIMLKKKQSLKTAKLLGVFEGAKETRECIEKVFGPILSNVLGLLDNIASLKLLCQTPVPDILQGADQITLMQYLCVHKASLQIWN